MITSGSPDAQFDFWKITMKGINERASLADLDLHCFHTITCMYPNLFVLSFYVPVNKISCPSQQIFSHVWTGLPWFKQCYAEGNVSSLVPLMRIEPETPRSRVQHSTTELLISWVQGQVLPWEMKDKKWKKKYVFSFNISILTENKQFIYHKDMVNNEIQC